MHNTSLPLVIQPSSGVPIYRQVIDQARALITGGRLAAGSLLPSVRQLAAELEVNMMTISKAYARLEAEGLVERVRGTGMRVREGWSTTDVVERQAQLRPTAEQLVNQARQLKLSQEQTFQVIRGVFQEQRS